MHGTNLNLPNGFSVSIIWGRHANCDETTVETAILDSDSEFVEWRGDDIQGYQTADDVSETITYAASLEAERPWCPPITVKKDPHPTRPALEHEYLHLHIADERQKHDDTELSRENDNCTIRIECMQPGTAEIRMTFAEAEAFAVKLFRAVQNIPEEK